MATRVYRLSTKDQRLAWLDQVPRTNRPALVTGATLVGLIVMALAARVHGLWAIPAGAASIAVAIWLDRRWTASVRATTEAIPHGAEDLLVGIAYAEGLWLAPNGPNWDVGWLHLSPGAIEFKGHASLFSMPRAYVSDVQEVRRRLELTWCQRSMKGIVSIEPLGIDMAGLRSRLEESDHAAEPFGRPNVVYPLSYPVDDLFPFTEEHDDTPKHRAMMAWASCFLAAVISGVYWMLRGDIPVIVVALAGILVARALILDVFLRVGSPKPPVSRLGPPT